MSVTPIFLCAILRLIHREELNRRMDNKRQEITDSQRTERQLEGSVHTLREERLRLQSQLQKRETLVSKKGDLSAQVETLERDVKVHLLAGATSCDYRVM